MQILTNSNERDQIPILFLPCRPSSRPKQVLPPNFVRGSYAKVVVGLSNDRASFSNHNDSPDLVLDDSCLVDKSFELTLIGKVKEFESLLNLRVICNNEGFQYVTMCYVGDFWISLEFDSTDARDKFQKHDGILSWFSYIVPWSKSFEVDERVV